MTKQLFSKELIEDFYEPVVYAYYDRADMHKTTKDVNWHRHKVYEIMYVVKGKADIWVDEGKIAVHNHQFMLLNSALWHKLSLEGKNFSMINIEFGFRKEENGEFTLKALAQKEPAMADFVKVPEPYLVLNDPDETILSFLKQTVALADSLHPSSQNLTTQLTVMLLLLLANRYHQENLEKRPEVYQKVLNKALEEIHKSYDKAITIKEIAENQGVHPTYLGRLFKEYLGVTPNSYLHNLRLEKAALRLATQKETILETGTAVGFNSQQYFIKAFKHKYRQTPGVYRREKEGNFPLEGEEATMKK